MAFHIYTPKLEAALIAEGLVPAHCLNAQIVMAANHATVLRYEVIVRTEDLPKLARAFAAACAVEEG